MKMGVFVIVLALAALACSLTAPPGSWANGGRLPSGANPGTATPTPAQTFLLQGQPGPQTALPTLNISTDTPSPSPATPSPTPPACRVYTGLPDGRLTLRSGPGVTFPALAWLREGDRLTVLEGGSWSHIQTSDGMTGWINSDFCEVRP